MEIVGRILVIAFVVVLICHFLRRPCNFTIVVRGSRVEVSGAVAQSKHQAIASFFRHDLPEVGDMRVRGYWDGRSLRLDFHGPLSPAHKQRIRNFLLITL